MEVRSPEHKRLGEALRGLRAERDISQEDLALRSGLDRSYYGCVERGERNPTYATLLRLAQALELPLSEIIARAERGSA